MAEPIEMPFGLLARISPRNHVLGGDPVVLRDIAMATNFETQFAMSSFVLTIATRQLVIEGLSGRLTNADIADNLHLRDVAMATIFGFQWATTSVV